MKEVKCYGVVYDIDAIWPIFKQEKFSNLITNHKMMAAFPGENPTFVARSKFQAENFVNDVRRAYRIEPIKEDVCYVDAAYLEQH